MRGLLINKASLSQCGMAEGHAAFHCFLCKGEKLFQRTRRNGSRTVYLLRLRKAKVRKNSTASKRVMLEPVLEPT